MSTQASQSHNYTTLLPEIEQRVRKLLSQMTLAEKVGQLFQVAPVDMAALVEMLTLDPSSPNIPELPERQGLREDIRAGRIGSLLNLADPAKVNLYQRIATQESRLGIPLLIGSDVIHGFRTVFPIPLAEACTWNPELLQRASRVAALEASAVGIDWIFAPMVDIARDPRWGRIAEGSGEDVHLGCVLAAARVRGFQAAGLETGRQVVACPKHYVAYGAAEAGRDYNTVDISERTLRDVHLPAFKAAFDAGAGSVMTSFNEIAGIPANANPFILRTILRDEWQWPGVTLSDYEAVKEMLEHGNVADLREAALESLKAGLDVEMVSDAYDQHLAGLVQEGVVDVALLDEAVSRVLRLKMRLGLFENPFVNEENAESFMLRDESRELALAVARQSMVLLKNEDGLLPLGGAQKIAVIGPLADERRTLLGCWTIFGKAEETQTILEAIKQVQPNVTFEAGCTIRGQDAQDFAAAVQAAQHADTVVLVLGEDDSLSGEARSKTNLGLPRQQQALAEAIFDTGKPVVTVLLSGRPMVIPELAERTTALLAAWHGGTMAAQAVADLLFGKATPSGKLSAGWPRSVGQLPMTYAHKNTGRPYDGAGAVQFGEPFKSRYIDLPNEPLFPFGFGLSYTQFEYSGLRVLTPEVGADGTIQVEVNLKNTGARAGTEVVQLYVRDLVGSVTRPVRELKGFTRVELAADETQTVRFALPVSELAFWRKDNTHGVEPGEFHVFVGGDSRASLQAAFVVGE